MTNCRGGEDRRSGLPFSRRIWFGLFLVLGTVLFFCMPAAMSGQERRGSASSTSPGASAGGNSADVARGKYLVESVAMCGQCHTPRDMSGNLDRSRWLEGAAVPWMPAQSQPKWPLMAPRIGGTPPASDADMIKLLTTGIWTTGRPLDFPMMPFRLNEADARAVLAYLKTPSAWK